MLDLGRHLVMHDHLLVLADDIDAQLQMIRRLQLVGLRLSILGRQSRPVNKSAVGRLDIADPYLALPVGPYFCVLSRQHLTVKKAVYRRRDRLHVSLPTDPERVGKEGDRDGFPFKGAVERQEVEHRLPAKGLAHGTAHGTLRGRLALRAAEARLLMQRRAAVDGPAHLLATASSAREVRLALALALAALAALALPFADGPHALGLWPLPRRGCRPAVQVASCRHGGPVGRSVR